MTPKELADIRKRAEASTVGPCYVSREDNTGGDITYSVNVGGLTLAFVPEDTRSRGSKSDARADAELYAHAREDVLALVAEVEALSKVLAGVDQMQRDAARFER